MSKLHQYPQTNRQDDVAERQDAFREMFAQYIHLYEHAPVVYIILDPEGNILYINPAGAALLAGTPATIVSRNFREFVDESERSVLYNYLQRMAVQTKAQDIAINTRIRLPHDLLCVRLVGSALTGNNGAPLLRLMLINATVDTLSGPRSCAGFDLKAAGRKAAGRDIQQEIKTIRLNNIPTQENRIHDEDGSHTGDRRREPRQGQEEATNRRLQEELRSRDRRLAAMTLKEANNSDYIVDWEKKLKKALAGSPADMKKAVASLLAEMQQNIKDNPHPLQYISETDEHFLTTIAERFHGLTPAEIRLCCLLRMRLTTKEIAHLLHISEKTVENQRYRLRAKLGLPRGKNLVSFLVSL